MRRHCNCSCGTTKESVQQHEEILTSKEIKSPPEPIHPPELPLTKRVKLVDNNNFLNKRDYEAVPVSDITSIPKPKTNFERQQSVQSVDIIASLINDGTFDPSDDCVDIPFSSHETDQLLSFPDRSSTSNNLLPPLPASLTKMPEIGIIRFLSDLSANRATSHGDKERDKEKKVPDMSTVAVTNRN